MKLALLTSLAAASVHDERLAQIENIQKTPGVTWTAGVNARFATTAPGSSASLNGVKAGWKARLASQIASGRIVKEQHGLGAAQIPEEFDSEKQWPHCAKIIGDIRDQSNCGCCWAFAGAEVASDRMCIASNATLLMPLSAEDVCFCGSDDGCNGGFVDEALDYVRVHGAVTGSQYKGSGPFGEGFCKDFSLPHCHHHGPQGDDPFPAEGEDGCPKASSPQCPTTCDSGASNDHADFGKDKYSFDGGLAGAEGEAEIQHLIMSGGPVETAFTVYSDFEDYTGGVYQHVTGDKAGGHAVKMVGWGVDGGTKYWKVANSWNPHWGEKGYFRILRGENHCGIEDAVVGSASNATWHNSVTPSTECGDQEEQTDCEKLDCKWCYIELFKEGFCLKPDSTACDSLAVAV